MKAKEPDWFVEANRVAQYAQDRLFEAHRGIVETDLPGVHAIFCNGGHLQANLKAQATERNKEEVDAVCHMLRESGDVNLAFGVSEDGYTWAMLCRLVNLTPEKITEALWGNWCKLLGGDARAIESCATQKAIAARVIASHGTPEESPVFDGVDDDDDFELPPTWKGKMEALVAGAVDYDDQEDLAMQCAENADAALNAERERAVLARTRL